MDDRRCRAAVWDHTGFHRFQCRNRAKGSRSLSPENRELPVCGVHLRPRIADEYRPYGRLDNPVEAVVRV